MTGLVARSVYLHPAPTPRLDGGNLPPSERLTSSRKRKNGSLSARAAPGGTSRGFGVHLPTGVGGGYC